jgi:phosphate transport system substrate-binding protein
VVNDESGRQRTDYNNIGEDDNAGLRGVQGDTGAMFYVGLSYVEQNPGELKAAEIENEDGECVEPSTETVQSGEYNPLGRPLFIYPSARALERPEVRAFLEFYVDNQAAIAEQALFVPLNEEQEAEAREDLEGLIATAATPNGTDAE